MAASRLPKPGTEFGPCPDPFCLHVDCQETRAQAASKCRLCGRFISYDVRFYNDPTPPVEGALVHADCLEEAQEG